MMSIEIQRYTDIVVQYKSIDMLDWCNENIAGYGRWVNPTFYFDAGYAWYARRYMSGDSRVIFSFLRPEDATLFSLRWA